MSTKTTTTDTATFNPAGMGAYNSLQPTIQSGLTQNMNDPWTAMAGNTQMAAGNRGIFDQSSGAFQNIAKSFQQRNIGSNSPLFASQLARMRRVTQGAQSDMYSNLLLQASNLRTGSATAASQYQPLQTGTQSVSSGGGLGSFL